MPHASSAHLPVGQHSSATVSDRGDVQFGQAEPSIAPKEDNGYSVLHEVQQVNSCTGSTRARSSLKQRRAAKSQRLQAKRSATLVAELQAMFSALEVNLRLSSESDTSVLLILGASVSRPKEVLEVCFPRVPACALRSEAQPRASVGASAAALPQASMSGHAVARPEGTALGALTLHPCLPPEGPCPATEPPHSCNTPSNSCYTASNSCNRASNSPPEHLEPRALSWRQKALVTRQLMCATSELPRPRISGTTRATLAVHAALPALPALYERRPDMLERTEKAVTMGVRVDLHAPTATWPLPQPQRGVQQEVRPLVWATAMGSNDRPTAGSARGCSFSSDSEGPARASSSTGAIEAAQQVIQQHAMISSTGAIEAAQQVLQQQAMISSTGAIEAAPQRTRAGWLVCAARVKGLRFSI